MNHRLLVIGVIALVLGACASVPKPLAGEFIATTPSDAAPAAGTAVRWGGTIVNVEPRASDTCFEVLAKRLNTNGRPLQRDESDGRFIACRSGFFDPEVFVKGRELTIVGRFERTEPRKIGEYDYPFPIVSADVVYLWPPRVDVDRVYYPSPFFGPTWWDFYHPFPYRYRTLQKPQVIGTPAPAGG
jgi:outer membrane lipoprotein